MKLVSHDRVIRKTKITCLILFVLFKFLANTTVLTAMLRTLQYRLHSCSLFLTFQKVPVTPNKTICRFSTGHNKNILIPINYLHHPLIAPKITRSCNMPRNDSIIETRREYGVKMPKKDKSKKGSKAKIPVTEEEMARVIDVERYKSELSVIVESLKENYIKHFSLRGNVGSLETLSVTIDGEEFPLNELAQVTRKNPQLVVVNMSGFPQGLQPVLEAIQNSGMNINPQQEGTTIYIPVPKVTREHREQIVKNAKTQLNKCKENTREVQNRYLKEAKQLKEGLSEDLVFNTQQMIMSMAEETNSQAEKLFAAKQEEILGK